jgi:acyl-CoA synthetase (AMP-forming)/AMP-acid ligase II
VVGDRAHPAENAIEGTAESAVGQPVPATESVARRSVIGPRPSPGELLEHLGPRIARFKHPKVVEFRDELPRTPTGKLSRSRVREEYLDR